MEVSPAIICSKDKATRHQRKPKTKEMLANELSDLLYSILVLAETYGVDLEEAYLRTLDSFRRRFLGS